WGRSRSPTSSDSTSSSTWRRTSRRNTARRASRRRRSSAASSCRASSVARAAADSTTTRRRRPCRTTGSCSDAWPRPMLSRVHHVGLVVRQLADGLALWRDRFGLAVAKQATIEDQGVRAALLPIGNSEIELLEPIGDGGVARFLAKRGEGLHHVCLESDDVAADLAAARARGLPLIDERPRPGLAGQICFLHPKGTRGALVEYAQPPAGERHHTPSGSGPLAGLTLHEVTLQTREAASAAELFATSFTLPQAELAAPPGM